MCQSCIRLAVFEKLKFQFGLRVDYECARKLNSPDSVKCGASPPHPSQNVVSEVKHGDWQKYTYDLSITCTFHSLCSNNNKKKSLYTNWTTGVRFQQCYVILSSPECQCRLRDPPSLQCNYYIILFTQHKGGRSVKLTTHLLLIKGKVAPGYLSTTP
jgi:hypothetical protein